jgi:hypothetical protein
VFEVLVEKVTRASNEILDKVRCYLMAFQIQKTRIPCGLPQLFGSLSAIFNIP